MYHCYTRFYILGRQHRLYEYIRQMRPPANFTYACYESEEPREVLLAEADVILAQPLETDVRSFLGRLLAEKKPAAKLILLVEGQSEEIWNTELSGVSDIWTLPMTDEEIRFRFDTWQKHYKMEKDLWQTEQFLDATVNSSPNLIWYKNKNGIHERVNDSFCRTVNKAREQIEGRDHTHIWDVESEDPAYIMSEEKVMRLKETDVFGETIQTREGTKLLTTYKSPLFDLDGSVMGTVGIALDVTQERAYEEEIFKKTRTLETIFTTLYCGVMCHTIDGSRIISVNNAALEILGYKSREELVWDGFDMVAMSVEDEDKPRLREAIQSLQKVGDSVSIEYRVRHRDGKQLHVMGNIKLLEENGELFYQRFLLDCTAEKMREKEEQRKRDMKIQYQEQIFEVFFTYLSNNTGDVYLMLDGSAGEVEYVSANVERVLGIPKEEIEKDLRKFGRARYLSGRKMGFADVDGLQPGDAFEPMETERINQKTGEQKRFLENVYCVSVQNVKKIIVYISDRTEEYKIQETLSTALNLANMANKAKSTFLSSVSHDIRTPMNAIMGLVTLMKEEADDPERVLEYTQKISSASQHLLGLINDVLDMNKIESGNTTLNISELNIAEIIDDLNTIIRPQTREKKQSFEIRTSFLQHEHLQGDKLRINQILINILSNAVKYTQEGGRIEMQVVELGRKDKYSRIRFVVKDNGQGMSEEYQKVLFDPFTRETGRATGMIQGTGLGMAITKSLINLMNGTIQVESRLGEGSTFIVELPLRIQEQEDDRKFWKTYGISRMIVVDNEEDDCKNVVHAMKGSGVTMHYATSGAAAIQMISEAKESGQPYNLILLDWKMPGQDGLETARLLREIHLDKVPIFLFTAYDWEEIKREALEIGIDHFLPKPFFMCNFKNVIRRVMDGKTSSSGDKRSGNVLKGKNVLVVDDIEVNRMILVKILNKMEVTCDVAENGQMALEKFKNSEPGAYDLILMDVQMPVMDGYEATRKIRASGHPSAKAIAIVAMTANAFENDILEALEAGMDAHVAKPIVVEQLNATLREVFDKKEEEGLAGN